MSYVKYGVKLSAGQKEKLAKALLNKSATTIRLTKSDLTGHDELMLTRTQLKRIQKAMKNKTGVDLKISKTQIRHLVQEGGSLLSSLLTLGSKTLPYAAKAVTKVAPALATGALQALGSLGIDKIFGKGQSGGFLIPQDKINQLIQYKDLLTKKQKEQIVSAIHTGGQLVVKPTKKQSGGFLGTLLTSIGVPLLLNALTGKGLQVDRRRSRRSANVYAPKTGQPERGLQVDKHGLTGSVPIYVPSALNKDGGLIVPSHYRSPPFIGTWGNPIGLGVKPKKDIQKKKNNKKKGKGLLLGKNSPFNGIPLLGAIL